MGKARSILAILIVLFLFSIRAYAEENKDIEIFDINQERVVKIIQPNEEIESLVLNYLNHVDGFVAKCNPIPKDGYAIRVPLKTSAYIHNSWINGSVSEIIIIVSDKEPEPFLAVFEDGDRFLCLSFKGNINELSKALNFRLKDFH